MLGHDDRLHDVREIVDNGEVEPVFNFRVAECHTYFVCDETGDISALVHNEYSGVIRQPIYNDDGSVTLVYDIYMLEPSLLALTELRHHVKRVQITVNPADAAELQELQNKYNQLMDSKIGTMNDAKNWNDFGDALEQTKTNAIITEVTLGAQAGGMALPQAQGIWPRPVKRAPRRAKPGPSPKSRLKRKPPPTQPPSTGL